MSNEGLRLRARNLLSRILSESSSQTSIAVKCQSCNNAVVDMGDIPFRTGGTSGAAHLLFGNWAELGEDVLHLDAFLCQQCGRVQLFADSQTRDSLNRQISVGWSSGQLVLMHSDY